MSWTVARLGSRFGLHLEPYHRRVMHSALGRFLDRPLDLMVGLVEPDGVERVLPFTQRGTLLYNPEQFERFNSITYRAFSERYRLRFELNIHSVFYPQDERLCTMPAFYLEMRVNPNDGLRWLKHAGPRPAKVKLFLRLDRPETQITACKTETSACIDLAYRNDLTPRLDGRDPAAGLPDDGRIVPVRERILSLNPGVQIDPDGKGLSYEMPVTEIGSGVKWRLVWAAYCAEPVLTDDRNGRQGKFRYTRYWKDLDAVMDEAVRNRDDLLAHSRRLEKAVEQAPLRTAQRHLVNQSFQSFLSNTFWCDMASPSSPEKSEPWFSVWEGSCFYHSTLDVEYSVSLFYLMFWPQLLARQFGQWTQFQFAHPASGGAYLHHDLGAGTHISGQAYHHPMPVEENANYLLLLQAYSHWTGDLTPAREQAAAIKKLTDYLLWTDRDNSGFPTEGTANTIDDGSAATQFSRKQMYLAVKRVAGLQAAADLFSRLGQEDAAEKIEKAVRAAAPRIESAAWLGDHYAVCVDPSTAGLMNAWTDEPLPFEEVAGWDAYSIYTANGLLMPMMIGQPVLLNPDHLRTDLRNAARETLGPYGCGHTSAETEKVWISQNLWRDHMGRYLGMPIALSSQDYWDLQVMSNTGQNSLGFAETYVGNNLTFYPRGVVAAGYFLAGPRLVIDRLATGQALISVDPDRQTPQRWPLMPLADWKAGKIPVCVVHPDGKVFIENEADPVTIL